MSAFPGNQYPVGNQVECFFCFTNRALTPAEQATFLSGGGLPAGVGVAQTTVKFQYRINGGTAVLLTGGSVVNDATGAYHAIITVTEAGDYEYQGFSLDSGGNPVAATWPIHFTGVPF